MKTGKVIKPNARVKLTSLVVELYNVFLKVLGIV
jgi:hypothetical protein